jgi:hypothetical protein
MPMFVLRLWLPDRPGALGAVASRVGSVWGDVIGIEIIDLGAGRAVDELTVDLPDANLLDLLVAEVRNVDGVDVEDVRPLGAPHEDPAVTALGVAAGVALAPSGAATAEAMVQGAVRLLHADWAVLVDLETEELVAGVGEGLPNAAWVCGFVRGAGTDVDAAGVEELAVATVPGHGWVLVVSRNHLPLRGRERALLTGLGALA